MFATLDLVSEGRAILGLGTGDPIDRPEHHAFGFPNLSVRDRRAHLAETVAALKALFGGKAYEGGGFVQPLEGPLLPPPVREGGPPIWLGAQSEEVVRMAGRLADGWNGWSLAPGDFRRKAQILGEEGARAGRTPEATWAGIVLAAEDEAEAQRLLAERERKGMTDGVAWAGPAEGFAAHLRELAAAGATWAIMVLAGPGDRRGLVAEQVLPDLDG
jgi:alkanesulfonate monooxygenase SsuD/methylene tetrahydromethanopterin reductase-like flavin-dependent oxidoreductase (luciferase family)